MLPPFFLILQHYTAVHSIELRFFSDALHLVTRTARPTFPSRRTVRRISTDYRILILSYDSTSAFSSPANDYHILEVNLHFESFITLSYTFSFMLSFPFLGGLWGRGLGASVWEELRLAESYILGVKRRRNYLNGIFYL